MAILSYENVLYIECTNFENNPLLLVIYIQIISTAAIAKIHQLSSHKCSILEKCNVMYGSLTSVLWQARVSHRL